MSPYRLVVFLHVASVLGLFAALALEWVSLRGLRAASTYEQARDWSNLWTLLIPIGMPCTVIVLASGIYMATTLGTWELGWIRPAVPSIVLIAIAGAAVGPRRNRLRAAFAAASGALPPPLQNSLRHPMLRASWRFRAALLFGLVFEMSGRPETKAAFLAIGLAVAIGIGWGLLAWRKRLPATPLHAPART